MGGLGEVGSLKRKSAQKAPHWPKRSRICRWKGEWWPSEQAGLTRAETAELGSPTAAGSLDPEHCRPGGLHHPQEPRAALGICELEGQSGGPTHRRCRGTGRGGSSHKIDGQSTKALSKGTVSSNHACPWPQWTLRNHSLGTPNPTIRRGHQSCSRKESDTLPQSMVLITLVLAAKELQPVTQVTVQEGGTNNAHTSDCGTWQCNLTDCLLLLECALVVCIF